MRGRAALERTRAVGVVVPVHNEGDLLAAALSALEGALDALGPLRLELGVVVVLDACDDASSAIARRWRDALRGSRPGWRVLVVTCDASNVGVARGVGCGVLLELWGDIDARHIWLATTDADSRVPAQWLASQVDRHEQGTELWTGRVAVCDWESYGPRTVAEWTRLYEAEDHPIHGASLGFNARAYLHAGGFPALATSEDRELCRKLIDGGARWYEERVVRVTTSARAEARAPRGFSLALETIDSAMRSSGRG